MQDSGIKFKTERVTWGSVLEAGGEQMGRVENWRSSNALFPVPPHQTVRSVFLNIMCCNT